MYKGKHAAKCGYDNCFHLLFFLRSEWNVHAPIIIPLG
jgi:hypothetical protein